MKGASETDDEPLWKMLFTNSCPVAWLRQQPAELVSNGDFAAELGISGETYCRIRLQLCKARHLAAADLRRHCRP